MADRREEILRKEVPADCIWEESRHLVNTPFGHVFNAMDEHAKQMCLGLLEYIGKNNIKLSVLSTPDDIIFTDRGKLLTKEEVFEIFL